MHQAFWFASRAFGITAMVGLAVSVALGLAMSGRIVRRPGLPATLKHLHEAVTLVTLATIALHGGLLLFDSYLRPGLAGISIPFAISYRPAMTGIGIIAAWLAAIRRGRRSAPGRPSGGGQRPLTRAIAPARRATLTTAALIPRTVSS